jgi:hypothetical protein
MRTFAFLQCEHESCYLWFNQMKPVEAAAKYLNIKVICLVLCRQRETALPVARKSLIEATSGLVYLTMTVCYFYPMVLSVLISAKANNRFKIPNREVLTDWARWIIRDVKSPDDILKTCVEGPVSDFEAKSLTDQVLAA